MPFMKLKKFFPCSSLLLIPLLLFWTFWSWKYAGFYQMLFLHRVKWLWFISFVLLMCYVTLVDFLVLNHLHSCDKYHPVKLWNSFTVPLHCLLAFHRAFFSSVFMRYWSVGCSSCGVLVWLWYRRKTGLTDALESVPCSPLFHFLGRWRRLILIL